jgi:hypothetical protein
MTLFKTALDWFREIALDRRGQLSITNMLAVFVGIIMLSLLLPIAKGFVDTAVSAGLDSTTATLLYLSITLLVAGLIVTIFRSESPAYVSGW